MVSLSLNHKNTGKRLTTDFNQGFLVFLMSQKI
mgnify:CR=1 FL=1